MEETSNTASDNRQSMRPNATIDLSRKRQKTAMFDTLAGSCCPSPLQNAGVFAAMNKLSKLVEHHPKLHSKLERMLEVVFNES